MKWAWAAMAAVAIASGARAEVAEQWETGFTTRNVVEVSAGADRAYAALGEIGRWWGPDHTYSRTASNMTLELKPGGCFCEAVPGGGVKHGAVVLAWPAQGTVRIEAALGPLQEMGVVGVLTFKITPKTGGVVEVLQTYTVGGGRAGLPKIVSSGVDQVVGEQLKRFEKYVETGKPE